MDVPRPLGYIAHDEVSMEKTAGGIIDLAVNIELEVAALYEAYARAFQHRAEVAYFWRLYAEAERYHAATIRIHQASFEGGLVVDDSDVDTSEARAFLDELRRLRAQAEKSPPSIHEALSAARYAEEHSAELNGRTQFFKNHPGLAELFARMAEEDRAHRDVLTTAEQRWGGQA